MICDSIGCLFPIFYRVVFLCLKCTYIPCKLDYFVAADIMQPKPGDELSLLTQEGMTVKDLEQLARDTKYNGFPVITDRESKRLVGYVYRRDLIVALGKIKHSTFRIK